MNNPNQDQDQDQDQAAELAALMQSLAATASWHSIAHAVIAAGWTKTR